MHTVLPPRKVRLRHQVIIHLLLIPAIHCHSEIQSGVASPVRASLLSLIKAVVGRDISATVVRSESLHDKILTKTTVTFTITGEGNCWTAWAREYFHRGKSFITTMIDFDWNNKKQVRYLMIGIAAGIIICTGISAWALHRFISHAVETGIIRGHKKSYGNIQCAEKISFTAPQETPSCIIL